MPRNYISKKTKIEENVKLNPPVRTYGEITIKRDCDIGSFTIINTGTRITKNTEIGKYCSIGRNCEIGAYEHPTSWLTSSPFAYNLKLHFPDYKGAVKQSKLNRPNVTIIGNDVWIGSSVIIQRGVRVGHGAVIVGGSIVTEDVPDYSIVGGVPATIIKDRFPTHIAKRLLKSEWWNIDYKHLKSIDFDNIEIALDQIERIPTRKQSAKINLFLSDSNNYSLVEAQLHGLVASGLSQKEYISTNNMEADKVNFSYFIKDDADVLLSHGVADKNYYWVRSEITGERLVNSLDGLLVQGQWMKRRLLNSNSITLKDSQIFTVGWPRLDFLRDLQEASPATPISKEIKICWAPTHDFTKRGPDKISTSSYPYFMKDAEKLAEKYQISFALHPRNSVDKKPTQDKLIESNIVISDFGTLVYEAWSLGKPVIFPRWILKNYIQQYLKGTAEAYIMENRIGYHPETYEEMIEIIESQPKITPDVDQFMLDYLDNYRSKGSVAKIIEALKTIHKRKFCT